MVFGVYNTNLFDSSRRNFCRRSLPQIDLGAGSLKRPTILPNHGPLQPADFRIRLEDSKCCTQGFRAHRVPVLPVPFPEPDLDDGTYTRRKSLRQRNEPTSRKLLMGKFPRIRKIGELHRLGPLSFVVY